MSGGSIWRRLMDRRGERLGKQSADRAEDNVRTAKRIVREQEIRQQSLEIFSPQDIRDRITGDYYRRRFDAVE